MKAIPIPDRYQGVNTGLDAVCNITGHDSISNDSKFSNDTQDTAGKLPSVVIAYEEKARKR